MYCVHKVIDTLIDIDTKIDIQSKNMLLWILELTFDMNVDKIVS